MILFWGVLIVFFAWNSSCSNSSKSLDFGGVNFLLPGRCYHSSGWNQPTNQQLELQKNPSCEILNTSLKIFVSKCLWLLQRWQAPWKYYVDTNRFPKSWMFFQQVYFLWNMAPYFRYHFFFQISGVGTPKSPIFFAYPTKSKIGSFSKSISPLSKTYPFHPILFGKLHRAKKTLPVGHLK